MDTRCHHQKKIAEEQLFHVIPTIGCVPGIEPIEAEGRQGKEKKADDVAPPAATAAGGSSEAIIIEACKQCNSFKTRAFAVKDGLESAIPGIEVILNPEKPRRGCFEVRKADGEIVISLLDMKRPFTPMKNLDMEKVVEDIVKKIK
ncbi:selenoprotein H-like [Asparagus officinalis]|uniref:selenoprotein H-like n=1 Tax=Asparagus officinalis TaxID=4686 RepID=UPI00098E5060|nr:selenoprotein H-like [Asparagus officinalis]